MIRPLDRQCFGPSKLVRAGRLACCIAWVALSSCPEPNGEPAPTEDVASEGVASDLGGETSPDVPASPDTAEEIVVADTASDLDSAGDTPDAPSGSYRLVQLETGLPSEYVFKDLWASQSGLAVAVGNDGVVAVYDGNAWNGTATGGAELLNAVHGTGANDVWAVGKDGVVLRGNSSLNGLTPFTAPGAPLPTLWGVSALSASNVVGVGLGGTIVRFDGTRWIQLSGPGQAGINWNGVSGNADKLVMVGENGAIGVLGGAGLELLTSPVTVTLNEIHSPDGTTFFAVGNSGTVLVGDGTNFSPMLGVPTFQTLNGVFAESTSSVFVVGNGGTLLHYNGATWTTLDAKTPQHLQTVYVSPAGNVTATGQNGALVEGTLAAGFSYIVALDKNGQLNNSWGQGENVVLVGDGAKAFHKTATWNEETTPITQNLQAVWGSSTNDIWAVGLLGKIIRWNGSTWQEFPSPTFDNLTAIWGRGPNDVFAVGAGGVMLHFDGVEWSLIASNTSENLRDVFALDASHIWAVGAQATIMFFDGLGWKQQTITPKVAADGSEEPWTDELHGVWAASPDDAWVVGANGQVARWDGQAWTAQELNDTTTLRGVYGQRADSVWAVGNQGHILYFNGTEWTPIFSGSIATLYAVDGDGGDQMFVAGDIGTILSLEWVPDE